jgi:hypothetical protein
LERMRNQLVQLQDRRTELQRQLEVGVEPLAARSMSGVWKSSRGLRKHGSIWMMFAWRRKSFV